MVQVLSGLGHCHDRGVCHRDLKLSNSTFPPVTPANAVLFTKGACECHPNKNGKRWILADFGFANIFKETSFAISKTRRGTDTYRSPELVDPHDQEGNSQPAEVSRKSDVWAVGCILFRLATTDRSAPFKDDWAVRAYKRQFPGFDLPQLNGDHNPDLSQMVTCPVDRLGYANVAASQ